MSQVRLHSSNPNLCAELGDFQTPVTRLIDGAGDYIKLQEDFCIVAQKGKPKQRAFTHSRTNKQACRGVLQGNKRTGCNPA